MQVTRIRLFINRFRRHFLSHLWFARVTVILLVVAIGTAGWFIFRRQFDQIGAGFRLITQSTLPSHSGRTNFLILGIAGGDHAGPDLTDTIIFVSFRTETGEAVILSLPRDIWVASLRAKINTAYHYGREKAGVEGGLILASSAVSEIINQPIDFTAVLDFSTFIRAIDMLGGVEIDVERSFVDNQFPIPGKENDNCDGDNEYKCRYESISFTAGRQLMDGKTALKYARSRYSDDPDEGSDFARSKRQERVISAVRSKLLSSEIIRKPQIYKDLYQLVISSIATDIKSDTYPALLKLANKARQVQFKTYSLSAPEHLYNPPLSSRQDYQWVLLPKNDQPQIIFDYVSSLLE